MHENAKQVIRRQALWMLAAALPALWILPAVAEASEGDTRLPVMILPVDVRDAASAGDELISELQGALEEAVYQMSSFRAQVLTSEALGAASCGDDRGCLAAVLPQDVLALDLRLSQASQEGALGFDLRLVGAGWEAPRLSSYSERGEMAAAVGQAAAYLLGFVRPEPKLYQEALEGDAESRRVLLEAYPESPWTRSLLRAEADES